MKWYPENLKQAMIPILVLNWLIGLGPVEYPIGNSRKKLSFIFVLIITFGFWFVNVIFELLISSDLDKYSLDVLVFTVLRFINSLTATVSLIIGWFYRQKMQLCIKSIELMDETFEYLGQSKNYNKIFKNSLFMTIIWLFLIIDIYIVDVYLHLSERKLINSMYYVFCFQWSVHTNTIVDVTFISALSCISSRFKKINYLLQGNSKNFKNFFVNKTEEYNRIFISVIPSESNSSLTIRDSIGIIKHIHLELCKTTRKINKIYGIQIALGMIANFMSITAFFYYLQIAFIKSVSSIEIKINIMTALGIWGIIYFSKLLHINIVSQRLHAEAQRTVNIVLDLKHLKEDTEFAEELEQFTLQLTKYPLFITMYGFNNLGYSFIVKFLGQVITYLVILIQIGAKYSTSDNNIDKQNE